MAQRVGITASVPIEVLFAADLVPVDLNNHFVTSGRTDELLAQAESSGFPRSSCAWAKGVYSTARSLELEMVIGVAEGDCSNTHAMLEILSTEGVDVRRFDYPYAHRRDALRAKIEAFAAAFGVTLRDAESQLPRTEAVREGLREVDRLTVEGRVSGAENLSWTVSGSDMRGDPEAFGDEIGRFLRDARPRPPSTSGLRIAVCGIPPAFTDLHDTLEALGCHVVLNEFPRQFAMLDGGSDLVDVYHNFTYPYDVFFRLESLQRQLLARNVQGVLHYVQSFCFRTIQDRLLRDATKVPVLTLAGDRPGPMDGAALTRVETFIEMLTSLGGSLA